MFHRWTHIKARAGRTRLSTGETPAQHIGYIEMKSGRYFVQPKEEAVGWLQSDKQGGRV